MEAKIIFAEDLIHGREWFGRMLTNAILSEHDVGRITTAWREER
jgi:hypothetical protein